MHSFKNLTTIGTSHIARQSLEEIEDFIETRKPDIIALELDARRAYALMHKVKRRLGWRDIRRIGLKGFLFGMLGSWVEKKLGAKVGIKPGAEMRLALKLAQQHRVQVAFIDQDIEVTLKKLSKAFCWKEKWSLVKDIFKVLVLRKAEIKFDLTKVPGQELIKELTSKVKKEYPHLYMVLVTERNSIMAKRLTALVKSYPSKHILAVVGAGHELEILEIIKKNFQA